MTNREQSQDTGPRAGRAAMNGDGATAVGIQQLIREALRDPTLAIAVAVPATGGYVGVDGTPLELPGPDDGHAVTSVIRNGIPVAAFVHDPELAVDESVAEALAECFVTMLENARLVTELRASLGRIVTAAEDERLQLESDLHDGAQQRLMAIQIKLGLLGERIAEPALAAALDEIAEDAAGAVADLRGVAQGIYPTLLRERGLGDALRSFVRTCPLAVEVADAGIGRCAPAVETAIYFCAIEAIQNASTHAGPGAQVRVSLDRRGTEVVFAVIDDGAGFAPSARSPGDGVIGMRDRIGAVGGDVEITSAPGGGTAVRGHAPASGPVSADG